MLPNLRRPKWGRRFFSLCCRCEKVGVADTGAVNKNYFIFLIPRLGLEIRELRVGDGTMPLEKVGHPS